ncbi:SRRM2 protein, partial [Aegotheles bennettii]|nr:SRRM2 protein [Aegotheles bennettii]
SMALYNNGADVPSPQEASNGFSQPGASGTWPKGEEEVRMVEPSMVKKAHREILDHERKRRVELKCMELQEMMEEQGYSEEEIRQKVGTFRQMLMEKEGVLTREDQHGRQIVIENHHGADGEEYGVEYPDYGEGCLLQCDCSAECYRQDSGHREYRLKRRSSSSTSPPPKKKKKKKSGHRRSRAPTVPPFSCDSSSPIRKEKKKKTGKKHRRDRSESGSRKKRRHRSRSPKNKRKEKNKERKRSRSESPAWRSHRRSSCSSHSASLSSSDSSSKSPCRLHPPRTHRPSAGSPSPRGRYWGNCQVTPPPRSHISLRMSPPTPGTSQGHHRAQHLLDRAQTAKKWGKLKLLPRQPQPSQVLRTPAPSLCPVHPPLPHGNPGSHGDALRGGAGVCLGRVKERHHRGRPNSSSESSAKHSRHASERRKSPSPSPGQRSSSWSSSGSLSKSRSRSREKRAGRSRSRSPSPKKPASREKDSEPRTRHGEPDPARARRRSRSYSPIRKRRRDSPSFMEPRRIT